LHCDWLGLVVVLQFVRIEDCPAEFPPSLLVLPSPAIAFERDAKRKANGAEQEHDDGEDSEHLGRYWRR
jgi:hypothetical protein